jgi:hypothetical protein
MWAASVRKLISGLLLSAVLLPGQFSGDKPERERAILIEAQIVPRCYGLDCPLLPVPFDGYLCFQVKDTYYTGRYVPWGFPWAPPGERLVALERQSVEVVVTDERIRLVAPLKVTLRRTRDYRLFKLASCNKA